MLLATLAVLILDLPTELTAYVSRPDASFAWRVAERSARRTALELTSQTWQGAPWRHSIEIVEPKRRVASGYAVLVVTGGEPNAMDTQEAETLASLSGLPVATLYNIPNQPLWGRYEDDLIAHTFAQYLETGDPTWPLLLPMTKAAVRAMDAVQGATKAGRNPLRRFVVTGASKRGWTTWLTAATGDPRVAGIAPLVYDNLNIPAQLRRQVELWGTTSPMIAPYTERGLHEATAREEGKRLAGIVDPYTYRERLRLPKLVVTGTNDPYWPTDATALYWEGLPGDKWACVVPNAGHGLGDARMAMGAMGAFARAVAASPEMPRVSWAFEPDAVRVACEKPFPESVRLWVAESSSLDFRGSRWSVRTEAGPGAWRGPQMETRLRLPKSTQNLAVLAEMRYRLRGTEFSTTSVVRLYPAR